MALSPVLAYNAAVSRDKVVTILRLMGFLSGDGKDDKTLKAALGLRIHKMHFADEAGPGASAEAAEVVVLDGIGT